MSTGIHLLILTGETCLYTHLLTCASVKIDRKMKRVYTRDTVSICLPQRLFIIHDSRDGYYATYLFQPYCGRECSLLVSALRDPDCSAELVDAWMAVFSKQSQASIIQHRLISQVCQMNTTKKRPGNLVRLKHEEIHSLGPIQVEYLYVKKEKPLKFTIKNYSSSSSSTSSVSSSSSSSSSSEESSSISSEEDASSCSSSSSEEEERRDYKRRRQY